MWSVAADFAASASVAATAEYGTPRANGTWLFELALNLKTPVIYDTVIAGDREERVVNQDETLAAREKQKLIKEKFRAWIFADPERTEKLVRLYNDTYNNLRPRLFDGAHLDFPGMNANVHLNPHQKDAVWRGMSAGNTLLAHCVGAGKTFTMAATGMKLKQAGLAHKPMYVVPNHMLEQFAREFMQLYPNAKLLVASKEDLTRERRKFLTAKIASGEWDGIIVTHSSFERIGMSKEYQQRFLREQIREYDDLLRETAAAKSDGAQRNLIKTIEKQKARREARLHELAAEDKKDDGLVFDELGVDHVFIDEAHYFKNLETPTKMERVAGIQTGGSERAFDLYMKAPLPRRTASRPRRHLRHRHADFQHHGGIIHTPKIPRSGRINQSRHRAFRRLGRHLRRGRRHDGNLAGRPVASAAQPVRQIHQSPRAATNVPGVRRRPDGRNAQPAHPAARRGQADRRRLPDVRGASRPPAATRRPLRPPPLAEGRSARGQRPRDHHRRQQVGTRRAACSRPPRRISPDSKINALIGNVASVWNKTAVKRGTQMIFCDTGVNPTPWGFCVYDEIIEKLVARGLPRGEIAVIGDADSDAKKQALFERMRNGAVRVLIGSTQKMGTGTNVQKRLVAKHDLDAPWKPAEVEQRDGRILRQGNENEEVAIYRYVTEGSFDSYRWQALETKARFIAQVMTGESAVRRAEDIGGQELSYAGNRPVKHVPDARAVRAQAFSTSAVSRPRGCVARRCGRSPSVARFRSGSRARTSGGALRRTATTLSAADRAGGLLCGPEQSRRRPVRGGFHARIRRKPRAFPPWRGRSVS